MDFSIANFIFRIGTHQWTVLTVTYNFKIIYIMMVKRSDRVWLQGF